MKFYDPHPGFAGAAICFPAPLQEVANAINGQDITIEEAIKRFESACELLKSVFTKCKVSDSGGMISIILYEGNPNTGTLCPAHSFRAIRYE